VTRENELTYSQRSYPSARGLSKTDRPSSVNSCESYERYIQDLTQLISEFGLENAFRNRSTFTKVSDTSEVGLT
jgi:hypothetical protein